MDGESKDALDSEGGEALAGAGGWWLVAQLPPSRPESSLELSLLRQLEGDELTQVREANALLARLASAAPYARLVELYEKLVAARGRSAAPPRKAADMNRAAHALAVVAASFGAEILLHAEEDFGEGPELEALKGFVAEECGRAPFRLLVAVAELADGPFVSTADGVVNNPAALALLGVEVPEVGANTDLVVAFTKAVLIAQRLLGRQLEVYGERLDAATLVVRRLAAEVFDGAPGLMRASVEVVDGKLNMGPAATPEALHVDRALYLSRARRQAQQLLVLDDPAEADAVEAPASGAGERPLEGGEVLGGEAVAGAGEAGAVPETQPVAEPPEPPPGSRIDQVLDLRALEGHVVALDALERVWSDAIESDALAAAQEEMEARFGSLLHSVQRRVAAADRALRAAGIDPAVPAYPLPVGEFAKITLEPDAERRLRQLQLVEVDALILLLGALEAIRRPSAQEITIATGEVESWWESGAFSLVRARLRLLIRVCEEAAAAESVLTATSPEEVPPAFFDRLRLASDALSGGDVDACLIQTALALRLRAALEGEPPADLLARLAADERVGPERVLLPLLDEALVRLAGGSAVDLGAALLIAPRLLALIGRLCMESPELVREAVVGAGEGE